MLRYFFGDNTLENETKALFDEISPSDDLIDEFVKERTAKEQAKQDMNSWILNLPNERREELQSIWQQPQPKTPEFKQRLEAVNNDFSRMFESGKERGLEAQKLIADVYGKNYVGYLFGKYTGKERTKELKDEIKSCIEKFRVQGIAPNCVLESHKKQSQEELDAATKLNEKLSKENNNLKGPILAPSWHIVRQQTKEIYNSYFKSEENPRKRRRID